MTLGREARRHPLSRRERPVVERIVRAKEPPERDGPFIERDAFGTLKGVPMVLNGPLAQVN